MFKKIIIRNIVQINDAVQLKSKREFKKDTVHIFMYCCHFYRYVKSWSGLDLDTLSS